MIDCDKPIILIHERRFPCWIIKGDYLHLEKSFYSYFKRCFSLPQLFTVVNNTQELKNRLRVVSKEQQHLSSERQYYVVPEFEETFRNNPPYMKEITILGHSFGGGCRFSFENFHPSVAKTFLSIIRLENLEHIMERDKKGNYNAIHIQDVMHFRMVDIWSYPFSIHGAPKTAEDLWYQINKDMTSFNHEMTRMRLLGIDRLSPYLIQELNKEGLSPVLTTETPVNKFLHDYWLEEEKTLLNMNHQISNLQKSDCLNALKRDFLF